MSDDTASLTSSSSLSSYDAPSTPQKRVRPRPTPLRLDHIGCDPSAVVGKCLRRIRRSPDHPVLTMDFTDNTTFQVRVDGYDPVHRGLPKALETDERFDRILSSNSELDLLIEDSALITLTDKAFQRKQTRSHRDQDLHWNQQHIGLAFKFAEENPKWHCVWARLEEFDPDFGQCVFRSYDDVYLDKLQRSPRKPRRRDSHSPQKARANGPF